MRVRDVQGWVSGREKGAEGELALPALVRVGHCLFCV